jgi:hypothetical protein
VKLWNVLLICVGLLFWGTASGETTIETWSEAVEFNGDHSQGCWETDWRGKIFSTPQEDGSDSYEVNIRIFGWCDGELTHYVIIGEDIEPSDVSLSPSLQEALAEITGCGINKITNSKVCVWLGGHFAAAGEGEITTQHDILEHSSGCDQVEISKTTRARFASSAINMSFEPLPGQTGPSYSVVENGSGSAVISSTKTRTKTTEEQNCQ